MSFIYLFWAIRLCKNLHMPTLYLLFPFCLFITSMQSQTSIQPSHSFYRISKIKAEDLKSVTFLTDPLSPYHSAPASVKSLFKEDPNDRRVIKIADKLSQFEPQISPGFICTKFIPSGTSYFVCAQCCYKVQPGSTMLFCPSCFEPQKHEGHSIRKQTSYGSAYCDCGREQRINPESFCKAHSTKQDRIVQIPTGLQQQFINYFEPLFLCYFYLRSNKQYNNPQTLLERLIQASLENLCFDSLIYTRMTTKIMKKMLAISDPDSQENKPRSILEHVVLLMPNSQKMFFAMTCDNDFKYEIFKAFSNLKSPTWTPSGFGLINSELYQADDILFRLAEQNIFLPKKQRYLQIANKSQAGALLFKKFLAHQKSKLEIQQYFNFFFELMPEKQIFSSQQLAHQLFQDLLQICNTNMNDLKVSSIDKKINLVSLMASLLFSLSSGNLKEIAILFDKQSKKKILDQFLTLFCSNIRSLVMKSGQKKQGWIFIIMSLILNSDNQEKYVKELWKGLTENDNQLRQDLCEIITAIYHLTAIIINSKQFLAQIDKKRSIVQQLSDQDKQNWMRSFLFENTQIPRQQVLSLRDQGFFNFPNAGNILRQLCVYDHAKGTFCYQSENRSPNYLMRFRVKRGSLDLRSIPNKKWRIDDKFETKEKREQQQQNKQNQKDLIKPMLNMLFNGLWIEKYLWTKWQTKINEKSKQQINSFWKNENLGYYFPLTLVYASVLCNHENESLKLCLSRLKQDPVLLSTLYSSCSDQAKLNELLQITDQTNPLKKQQKQSNQQNKTRSRSSPRKQQQQKGNQSPSQLSKESSLEDSKKKLFEQRKKKLQQKFKQVSSKFIIEQKMKQVQNPEQAKCIICKQANFQNDNLMYISNMTKNSSPTNNLYGNFDRTEIRFTGCLHVVHSNCFANLPKSNFDFNCPLCSKRSNICLPTDASNYKSIRRCNNIVNAIQVMKYKNNDYNGLLMTCIRHLVGNALDWIIYAANLNKDRVKQRERRKKINQIVLKIIQIMATKLGEGQKLEFQEEFKSFTQKVDDQAVPDKMVCLIEVQILLAKALYNKIFKQQQILDTVLITSISQKIETEDLVSLQQVLSDLCDKQFLIDVPEKPGKVFLSFRCASFPKNITQFKGAGKCENCNNPQKFKCLQCCQYVCQACLQKQSHIKQHNKNILALDLQQKRILIKQTGGTINGSHHLYYDGFMTPYDSKSKTVVKQEQKMNFELDKRRVQKIIMSFLMRV